MVRQSKVFFSFFLLSHQYAGCVLLRLYCISLLWTPLLVEGHGPPCVKVGNASWAFLAHYPGLKEKYYVPHCKQRPSVSHVPSLLTFFRGLFIYLHWWTSEVGRPEIFFTWCFWVPPAFGFFLVGLHVLLSSPLLICRSAVTFYFIFSDLARPFESCTVLCSFRRALGSVTAGRWRVWGCAPLLCRVVCSYKCAKWRAWKETFGTEFLTFQTRHHPETIPHHWSHFLMSSQISPCLLTKRKSRNNNPNKTPPRQAGQARPDCSAPRPAPPRQLWTRRWTGTFVPAVFSGWQVKSLLEHSAQALTRLGIVSISPYQLPQVRLCI